jgi:hypothetical protein
MRAHTIAPRGILALSFAVVLLAATASTASAERVLTPWYCPPLATPPTSTEQIPEGCLDPYNAGPSFDFGDRQVGTTSPAQGFALGVYNNGALNPRISVSGDYAQTNNCPPTLSATGEQIAGCLITVTFAPTGTGPKHGTLSTGAGGPTATLTGNGVTTPTPPALPLALSLGTLSEKTEFALWGCDPITFDEEGNLEKGRTCPRKKLGRTLPFSAVTNNDSKLVATGRKIEKTTKRLAAGERTKIEARLKHPKRLNEKQTKGKPTVKIRAEATDGFGQTATDEFKVKLYRNEIKLDSN